jgi:hypothetical protein
MGVVDKRAYITLPVAVCETKKESVDVVHRGNLAATTRRSGTVSSQHRSLIHVYTRLWCKLKSQYLK